MTKKQFYRLSKKRRAIAVAEDVLLQIKSKKYIPNSGQYIAHVELEDGVNTAGQINEQFDKIKECVVFSNSIHYYLVNIKYQLALY